MNRHVPGGVRAADRSRWLVIANQDHHQVALRVLAQVSAEHREIVSDRVNVAGAEIGPIGLAGIGVNDVGAIVGPWRQHPRPMRLIRRRWTEWEVGADRRKK